MSTEWKKLAKKEIAQAENSRTSGNEGRARVCARRAAGHVADEFLRRKEIDLKTDSALQKLRYLSSLTEISTREKETVEHFLIHTSPDHTLPIDADLIADVDLLARWLLDESLD